MRHVIYILTLLIIASCGNNSNLKNKLATKRDSITKVACILNALDTNIINNSDRKIDVLFNGVNGFLGGIQNDKVYFDTECIGCEPIQHFKGHLLFGKRLLLKNDEVEFYKQGFQLPDSSLRVKRLDYLGEKTSQKFNFHKGKGTMKYIEQSCDDADYVNVKLYYDKGNIEIKNILDPSFFEYDLNKDGTNEQYLLGSRNCSQELVILRVSEQKSTSKP